MIQTLRKPFSHSPNAVSSTAGHGVSHDCFTFFLNVSSVCETGAIVCPAESLTELSSVLSCSRFVAEHLYMKILRHIMDNQAEVVNRVQPGRLVEGLDEADLPPISMYNSESCFVFQLVIRSTEKRCCQDLA